MNDEYTGVWKDAVLPYVKLIFRSLFEETYGTPETPE